MSCELNTTLAIVIIGEILVQSTVLVASQLQVRGKRLSAL